MVQTTKKGLDKVIFLKNVALIAITHYNDIIHFITCYETLH